MSRLIQLVGFSLCCWGAWWSFRIARADWLFRKDTPPALIEALQLVPDRGEYYTRLAKLDEPNANQLLGKALAVEPFNAQASIELAVNLEAEGKYPEAERLLLRSFEIDRTYLPRWSLANFYFRRGNEIEFWKWARRAAEMPSTGIGPLFQLCWRATPNAEEISRLVVPDNPAALRQFLAFLFQIGLTSPDRTRAAVETGTRLLDRGDALKDRGLLFSLVDRLVEVRAGAESVTVWRNLIKKQWTVVDPGLLNNGSFARKPLSVSFDWSLPSNDGMHSWPGPAGLEVEFSGKQPENCMIAGQIMALEPGHYRLNYHYRTKDIAAGTGLQWRVLPIGSEQELAHSTSMWSESGKDEILEWSVSSDSPLVRILLDYHQSNGSPPITGLLVMESASVERR